MLIENELTLVSWCPIHQTNTALQHAFSFPFLLCAPAQVAALVSLGHFDCHDLEGKERTAAPIA